jgi:hypothetical protein
MSRTPCLDSWNRLAIKIWHSLRVKPFISAQDRQDHKWIVEAFDDPLIKEESRRLDSEQLANLTETVIVLREMVFPDRLEKIGEDGMSLFSEEEEPGALTLVA